MTAIIGALVALLVIIVDECAGWGLGFWSRMGIILVLDTLLMTLGFWLKDGRK